MAHFTAVNVKDNESGEVSLIS